MNKKTIYFIFLSFLSVIAAVLVVKHICFMWDSFRYGLVADEILKGNGLKVPLLYFHSNLTFSDGSVPFLVQPPLFPIALAVFGGISVDNYFAAQLLNFLSFYISVVLSYLILVHFLSNRFLAFFSTIAIFSSLPMLRATATIWSELLFTTFSMVAIYFILKSRISEKGHYYAIAVGILSCSAILTRYIGVCFILLISYEILHIVFITRNKKNLISYSISLFLTIFALSMLFLRNYLVTGSIRGYEQLSFDRSLSEAFSISLEMLYYGFKYKPYLDHLPKPLFILILCFIVGICFHLYFRNNNYRMDIKGLFLKGMDVLIVYLLSYFFLMVYVMLKVEPAGLSRFFTPLVPILLILLIANAVIFFKHIFSSRGEIFVILLLSITFLVHLNLYQNNYKAWGRDLDAFRNNSITQWVIKNCSKDQPITTNQHFLLSFVCGNPVMRIPRTADMNSIPDDLSTTLQQRMYEVGTEFLVLYHGVNKDDNGSYMANLYNNRVNRDNFEVVFSNNQGVIYKLRQEEIR
ncbi:hypothetical protein D3OALGA1CA_2703 [Olavius algarvensis associated proteobacterium Delta 3]|nr:hypothetical protein D3OALGB2SA_2661 [Olavius algarvensis associated proteobacterium Delta 3]CAB5123054.1 hypothetical protein D3OALGA1CA_2703 [Olavius algarvensis associated proteobacterium Delta 3]